MYEYMIIRCDGRRGWVWTNTYQSAYEIACDYMGEFVTVIPTGKHV